MIRIESLKAHPRPGGVENLLCGPAKILEKAAMPRGSLLDPIEQLGIEVGDLTEKIFLSDEDRQFAQGFLLPRSSQAIAAIHPGSGSKEKNWPLQNWIELFPSNGHFSAAKDESGRMGKQLSLVVVSGEADNAQTAQLEHEWKDRDIRSQKICHCRIWPQSSSTQPSWDTTAEFSHLAAAAGANCILLFGPTDPNVWAPRNENVRVLRGQSGRLNDLDISQVRAAVTTALRPVLSRA